MLGGELVNENSTEEPVCLRYSEGLVVVNVGALPPVLRGELVNENSREEPVVCILVLEKMRTTINAALWGIWNGCVSFQALSL